MEYINTSFDTSSIDLREKFLNLKSYLNEQDREGNILLLFRGEQKSKIQKRLFGDATDQEDEQLFNRVFYFGEKARHYSIDDFNIGERNHLTSINDCSEETFRFIFNKIAEIFSIRNYKKRQIINQQTSENFRNYFENHDNLIHFITQINNINSLDEKLKVRDYYLYFLHVAGKDGVYVETMLVSTSTKRQIARSFSWFGNRTNIGIQQDTSLIFHYFVPKPFQFYIIAPWLVVQHLDSIQNLHLPTFKVHGLYPTQMEVAVKGCLFPQFLIGLELLKEKQFIINPYINLIPNSEEAFFNVSVNGLPIDQSDFATRIPDSSHLRWIQTDSKGNFEQFDVIR